MTGPAVGPAVRRIGCSRSRVVQITRESAVCGSLLVIDPGLDGTYRLWMPQPLQRNVRGPVVFERGLNLVALAALVATATLAVSDVLFIQTVTLSSGPITRAIVPQPPIAVPPAATVPPSTDPAAVPPSALPAAAQPSALPAATVQPNVVPAVSQSGPAPGPASAPVAVPSPVADAPRPVAAAANAVKTSARGHDSQRQQAAGKPSRSDKRDERARPARADHSRKERGEARDAVQEAVRTLGNEIRHAHQRPSAPSRG